MQSQDWHTPAVMKRRVMPASTAVFATFAATSRDLDEQIAQKKMLLPHRIAHPPCHPNVTERIEREFADS
jgi:hypothetical protein